MKKRIGLPLCVLFLLWTGVVFATPVKELYVDPLQVVYMHNPVINGGVYIGTYFIEIAGKGPIGAYCVDPYQFSRSSATEYLILGIPNSNTALVRAAWIMENYPVTSGASDRVNAQAAIWEIMSPDAARLDGGSLRIDPWSGFGSRLAAQGIVDTALALDLSNFDANDFEWLHNERFQDYIVQHTAPEPATMFLLGSGLLGLAVVVRKKIKHR